MTLVSRAAETVSTLTGWRRRGLALTMGLLAALALPPVHALPVLWLSFPVLIWLIDGTARPRAAFWAGWWWGFSYSSVGIYWIANAMLVDPAKFGWMIPFAVFGLGGVLAVFIGLAACLARCATKAGPGRVLIFAAAWVLLEWVRSWFLTGFSWNLLGTVWMPVGPVLQFAAVAGAYGLSLLTVVVAAMPAVLAVSGRGNQRAMVGSLLVVALVVVWGAWPLRFPRCPRFACVWCKAMWSRRRNGGPNCRSVICATMCVCRNLPALML